MPIRFEVKRTGNIEGYNIEIKVTTLDEVAKVVQSMKNAGFADFSVSPRRLISDMEEELRKKQSKRHNNFILASLYYAKAFNEKSAKTIEEILDIGTKNLPTQTRITADNEGIARRTMNMIATVVLADKHKLIKYTNTEPKKFWLTNIGIEPAKKLLDNGD